MRPILVQPAAGARVSGGYLYNARMAAQGVWDLLDVHGDGLAEAVAGIANPFVIADSIWLTETSIAPFVALAERGVEVAVMMHSFPSMIAATECGQEPPSAPTSFEIEALQRLGTMLVPGPHYAQMLAGAAIEVLVLSPGIDDDFRATPRPRRGRAELISVGAVSERKGFVDVARWLAGRSRHDDYHWTIVGDLSLDPSYADALRRLVEPLGTVSLLGTRPPPDTRALMKTADLLLMPSYDENHPLVLLEAMAASVPCVAYAAGAAAQMLGHGKAGIVRPIGDARGLGDALERLLANEAERFALANGAWELGRTLPNWQQAALQARASLERVMP